MKKHLQIIILTILLTGCYVSKEHRQWESRDKNNLGDNSFYKTLNDTCAGFKTKIKMNFPYICTQTNGYFHAYTFDNNKNVYSNAWVNEKPDLSNILANQRIIGHYKICGDTLTIEQIGSWTFMNMPWKYTHTKTLGLISGDTIKLSKEQLDIKLKDKMRGQIDVYLPIDVKASR